MKFKEVSMENKLRRSFSGLFIAVYIVGCGGTSSESTGTKCVNLPRPAQGLSFIHKKTSLDPNASFHSIEDYLSTEKIIDSFSDVLMTTTGTAFVTLENVSFSFSEKLEFTIINGYQNISYHEYNDDSVSRKTFYSPPKKQAMDIVCENQTWTNTYNTDGSSITSPHDGISIPVSYSQSTIHTIESINEPKTVIAGSFITFRERVDFGSFAQIIWRDQNTGIIVLRETTYTGSDDNLVYATFELISLF